MKYILDTDITIFLLRENKQVISKLVTIDPNELAVTSATVAELLVGVHRKKSINQLNALERFFSNKLIFDFNFEAAQVFARLKTHDLKNSPLDDMDLMIASICIVQNATLVTNNEKHFRRIKGLKIENWLKGN